MSAKKYILDIFGREPATLDELAECVIAVIESQYDSREPVEKFKVLGFAWELRHSEHVSNGHSSPDGYPQNWGRKEGLPTGYPGWTGRVWIRYSKEPRSFANSPFPQTLTHTGTGGAGSYNGPWSNVAHHRFKRYGHISPKNSYPRIHCYSWDYRFYDLDWPLLSQWVEKQKMWAELKGQSWDDCHRFKWIDPATLQADLAFIEECATIKAKETL